MKKFDISITDIDSAELYTSVWVPAGDPVGVVQIIHGMAEHSGRYREFAEYLAGRGLAVYAHDHRGHGRSAHNGLGVVHSDDSFHTLVDGILAVYNRVKKEHAGLPVTLLGHSMGSFLLQRLVQLHTIDADAIIYSGSNGKPQTLLPFGVLLSSILTYLFGPDKKSPLIDKLTFAPYNHAFKPNRTDFDWLSRNTQSVDRFIDDPLCGFIYSTSFYRDLFRGLQTLYRHKPFSGNIPTTPILLISGDKDPVSNMGEGVLELEKRLRDSGVKDITVKIYNEGRHEMLHELNRDTVMADLFEWLAGHSDIAINSNHSSNIL